MKPILRSLFALCICVILSHRSSAQEFSKFCKTGAKVSLFLVDRTTPFDSIDENDLIQGLQKIYDNVGSGERLIVHELATKHQATRPIFDACRPVCGDTFMDAFLCDTASAKKADRSYTERVVERFRKLIRVKESYPDSELLEGITLLTEEYKSLNLSNLYMFSDFLENSKTVVAERLLDTSQIQTLLDTSKSSGYVPVVKGVRVRGFGMGRWHGPDRRSLTLRERRALLGFWTEWFKLGGAPSVTITERYISD